MQSVGSDECEISFMLRYYTLALFENGWCYHWICKTLIHNIILPAVATPMVTVDHNPDIVYTDEDFTLTCTIELDSAVDTDAMVTAEWIGPDGELTGTTPTDTDSDGTYESTLTPSVDTAGSVDYTCTATVSPDGTPFVTTSDEGADSETVTIGEFNKFHYCVLFH